MQHLHTYELDKGWWGRREITDNWPSDIAAHPPIEDLRCMAIGENTHKLYGYVCFDAYESNVTIVHLSCWGSDFGVKGTASRLLQALLAEFPRSRFIARLQMHRLHNESWEVSRQLNMYVTHGFMVRYTEWDTPDVIRFVLRRDLFCIKE